MISLFRGPTNQMVLSVMIFSIPVIMFHPILEIVANLKDNSSLQDVVLG